MPNLLEDFVTVNHHIVKGIVWLWATIWASAWIACILVMAVVSFFYSGCVSSRQCERNMKDAEIIGEATADRACVRVLDRLCMPIEDGQGDKLK